MTAAAGTIGPNAAIQLWAALSEREGQAAARSLFADAGVEDWCDRLPDEMVPENAVAALYRVLFDRYPSAQARDIAVSAGQRVADYVMANRIPSFVRITLKSLPARPARFLLLKAIAKNAWTFAGSGQVRVSPHRIEIIGNPLRMPGCAWHVGVFERLFCSLVSPRTRVRHSHRREGTILVCGFDIVVGGA